MLNCSSMTNEDRVVEAAKALNDDEKRRAAERILKLVPTYATLASFSMSLKLKISPKLPLNEGRTH